MFMKKLLCVLAITVFSVSAMAQGNINKGNILLGGQMGFSSTKVKDQTGSTTSFEFNPNVGYFFANQFAGGIRMGITTVKHTASSHSYSDILVSPFLRYYFMPASNKVNIFADGSYGFGSQKDGTSESMNQFSIMAGPSIFLNPSVALEIGLGYTSMGGDAFTYGGKEFRQNTIGLKFGFQIHLGGGAAK
jgi:opacity protein-like surface antigen